MNSRLSPEAAVIVSTPVPWIIGGSVEGLVSLALGMVAVFLTRTVFVNRENRALGYKQKLAETLPITLLACLITGGLIVDRHLLYSAAIFTGVAVGWSTIATINLISKVVNPGGAMTPLSQSPRTDKLVDELRSRPLPPPDPEHQKLLRQLDGEDG